MTANEQEILAGTAIVIPAYNAAAHLAGVIEQVTRLVPPTQIIVVDDGSADDTAGIAETAAVHVERHGVNRGKGAALNTGIRRAMVLGMPYAITMDADGQHSPDEIGKFIAHQASSDADIIVGDRMSDRPDMPPLRVFANRTTSWFVSLRAGVKIPDSQNGFRMLKTAIFEGITLETTRYDTESEILIKAAKNGARIESIPVRTIYGSEKSTVNPVIDTVRFFRLVFRSFFW